MGDRITLTSIETRYGGEVMLILKPHFDLILFQSAVTIIMYELKVRCHSFHKNTVPC